MPSDSLSEARHLRSILEGIKGDLDAGRLEVDDELGTGVSACLASLNAKMSTWDRAQHDRFMHIGSSRFDEAMELAEYGLQSAMIEARQVIKTIEKVSGQKYLASPNTGEPIRRLGTVLNSRNKVPGRESQRSERTKESSVGIDSPSTSKNSSLWSIGLFLLLAFITVLLGFGILAYFLIENPYLAVLLAILSIITVIAISILALLYAHAISEPGALKVLDKIVKGLLRVDFLQAIENRFRSMARNKK